MVGMTIQAVFNDDFYGLDIGLLYARVYNEWVMLTRSILIVHKSAKYKVQRVVSLGEVPNLKGTRQRVQSFHNKNKFKFSFENFSRLFRHLGIWVT